MKKSLKGGIKNLNGLLLTLFSTLRDYTTARLSSVMDNDIHAPRMSRAPIIY